MEPDDRGCDLIPRVGRTVIGEEKGGGFDAFALGSGDDNLNPLPGPTIPLGGVSNPFDQVGADHLHLEDWDIAIDALLEADSYKGMASVVTMCYLCYIHSADKNRGSIAIMCHSKRNSGTIVYRGISTVFKLPRTARKQQMLTYPEAIDRLST